MTSRPAGSRRHLASSPFQPKPAQEVEIFEVDDRVSHDSYGLGRVSGRGGGGRHRRLRLEHGARGQPVQQDDQALTPVCVQPGAGRG